MHTECTFWVHTDSKYMHLGACIRCVLFCPAPVEIEIKESSLSAQVFGVIS